MRITQGHTNLYSKFIQPSNKLSSASSKDEKDKIAEEKLLLIESLFSKVFLQTKACYGMSYELYQDHKRGVAPSLFFDASYEDHSQLLACNRKIYRDTGNHQFENLFRQAFNHMGLEVLDKDEYALNIIIPNSKNPGDIDKIQNIINKLESFARDHHPEEAHLQNLIDNPNKDRLDMYCLKLLSAIISLKPGLGNDELLKIIGLARK